jgi:hypothetical protein
MTRGCTDSARGSRANHSRVCRYKRRRSSKIGVARQPVGEAEETRSAVSATPGNGSQTRDSLLTRQGLEFALGFGRDRSAWGTADDV